MLVDYIQYLSDHSDLIIPKCVPYLGDFLISLVVISEDNGESRGGERDVGDIVLPSTA